MTDVWQGLVIELVILALLGVGYYLFQKRRILRFEANKVPYLYSRMLQLLLVHKDESIAQPKLDDLIIKIDDFINQTTNINPKSEVQKFLNSSDCHSEYKEELRSLYNELP